MGRLTRWRQLRRLFYYWRHYYNMSVYSRKIKTIIRGMRDTYVYGLSLGYPVDANTLLHQYVDASDLEYVKKKVGNMHSEPSTRQTERALQYTMIRLTKECPPRAKKKAKSKKKAKNGSSRRTKGKRKKKTQIFLVRKKKSS